MPIIIVPNGLHHFVGATFPQPNPVTMFGTKLDFLNKSKKPKTYILEYDIYWVVVIQLLMN